MTNVAVSEPIRQSMKVKAQKRSPRLAAAIRQGGFTMVELMVALGIIGIVLGFAIPNIMTGIQNMQLRSAASDFSGLVQRARIQAVRDNAIYTIYFGSIGAGGNGAYVNTPSSSTYSATLPMIQFGGNINQVSAPGGSGGKPTNLDASGGPLGWTATSGNVSFNSRGFPCSGSPCTTNVNYVFYFSDTRANGSSQWAAVSITAAGHPKTWSWNGTSWTN